MRLLHTTSLTLHEFPDSSVPPYAILSHTWGKDEVSLHDVVTYSQQRRSHSSSSRFQKMLDCCKLAKSRDLEWAWIDTCCIAKTSSAELSEAINSMFNWYSRAKVCFVFLSDFDSVGGGEGFAGELGGCRWFTRGWTLQELLAPENIVFYDAHLNEVGSRLTLSKEISAITGIGEDYLLNLSNIHEASIARRMSWASDRETSRMEDTAYCLLGLFDVNMPLLYGEGRKAFLRLQQQIISQSNDESIFAWTSDFVSISRGSGLRRGMFAEWPSEFKRSGMIRPAKSLAGKRPPYIVTNRGLQLHVPATPWRNWLTLSIPRLLTDLEVWLDCEYHDQEDGSRKAVGLRVGPAMSSDSGTANWYRVDAAKLVLKRENIVARYCDSIFSTYTPIYIAQSSPDSYRPILEAAARARSRSIKSAFDHQSRQSRWQRFEGLLTVIWIIYIARYSLNNVGGMFSTDAAWTWYYLTYGLTFSHSSYWFLALVGGVLHLEASLGILSNGILVIQLVVPVLVIGTTGLYALAADGTAGGMTDYIGGFGGRRRSSTTSYRSRKDSN